MGWKYASGLRTTRMNAVVTAIDAGSSNGTLEICSASYAAVLATHDLSDPCGSVSGDVLTFGAIDDATIATSGTAAIARIKDSDGNIIVSDLTVGTSGTDVIVGSTTYTSGVNSQVSSATLTHYAGA